MFFKIGVLKIFANFTGKHLCWSFYLIKLQASTLYYFIKIKTYFAKLLRTFILQNTRERLLLKRVLQSYRSNHRKRSVKKGVLKNLTKFTGKHLFQSLFFNKVTGLRFSLQWKVFLLMEVISFQWKGFPLMKVITFGRSHYFGGNRSSQWKSFLLVQVICFSRNHSLQ